MRNHEPCAKALGNNIYVCHASAHAQDNNNNNYLYVQWVAMVFLVYCSGLREASALMRISSIYIYDSNMSILFIIHLIQ